MNSAFKYKPESLAKIRAQRARNERKRRSRRTRAAAIAKAPDYSITLDHLVKAYEHAYYHQLDPNLRSAIAKCMRVASAAYRRNHDRTRARHDV